MINLGSIYCNLFAHVYFATDTIRDPFSPCLTKIPAGSVESKEGLCCQRLMLQDVLAIVLLSSNLPQGIKKKKTSAIPNHWNSHYGTLIVFEIMFIPKIPLVIIIIKSPTLPKPQNNRLSSSH